jgi:SMC interacting uncharacterized protein involved in chromosome segregation
MENNKYIKILEDIETAEASIANAKDKLMELNQNLVKTQREFNLAIEKVAEFLAKTNNRKTVSGVKIRLLKKKKIPNAIEAYEIRNRFGIPIEAWLDIAFYKKTLPVE